MSRDEILKYITETRNCGYSDEAIAKELLNAGWRIRDFVDILLEHSHNGSRLAGNEDNIITVRNVNKSFGTLKALDNVSLDVKRKTISALLGPNGAGKTTLIRILTTLLKGDSGRATVANFDVVRDAQQLRSVIGLTGQFTAIDEILTGRENLEMVGRLYHLPSGKAKERARELLHEFDLDDAADRILRTYSGGMRRRLDLAASLVANPDVLFLDEPTTGLDPQSRFALWRVIEDLVERGTTVLLTTQYLEEADQLAEKIFVMNHGQIIAQGTADELKRQIGGDVLELHLTNHKEAAKAADILKNFGDKHPHADSDTGIVTLPVTEGASVLPGVIRELDNAKLNLSDISLRRPSLDEVFLRLTGQHEASQV